GFKGLAGSGEIPRWWPRAESNHRHEDFQSSALPTELLGHACGIACQARVARISDHEPRIRLATAQTVKHPGSADAPQGAIQVGIEPECVHRHAAVANLHAFGAQAFRLLTESTAAARQRNGAVG